MTSVPEVLRSQLIWAVIGSFIAFWVAAQFVPNLEMQEIERMVQASVFLGVLIAFFPTFSEAIRKAAPSYVQQFALGLALIALHFVGSAPWLLLWRMAGQPAWMVNSDLNGFWTYISIIGGILCLMSHGAIDGQIPKRSLIILGSSVSTVALIILLLFWTEPNLSPVLRFLEPLITESSYDGEDNYEATPRRGFLRYQLELR